ncbi:MULTISPECIES: type IV conjugative transfer system protein TraL [Alphaproteobacteria]|jgi:conjugal transfer pilus assembly protein TraL|uniref:Type IV conjugative transfer system protein TraL n=1 Tax=Maricaulis virginensis TaxID=144022 RepID=A0A9W6IQJ9_9PROT|nr:type IV conjugative transfer system protein TraL [Maricaulis virginensis]GLK53529.1 hypothetical protein GCM10017621_30370 [Maricaulis virginensis]
MSGNLIPQRLDEPERILIFTPVEFVIVVLCLGTGLLSGHVLIGLIAALLFWQGYQKAKAGLSLQRLFGRMYWLLPPRFVGLRRSPDAALREWVG